MPEGPMTVEEEQAGPSRLLRSFYPSLDGLRAIAFLFVFLTHYAPMAYPADFWDWGWTGVDIFFVLSGFLITGILYDSLHRDNFFKDFYIRRALRIFPLYYAFWLLVVLLTPLLHVQWNRYVAAMAVYAGNFFVVSSTSALLHPDPAVIAYSSLRHPGQVNFITIRHFWSLCVEEQFYLVWPAIIWFVRSRRTLLRICLTVIVSLPLLRALSLHWVPEVAGHKMLYFNTFARADTLLAGAAIALLLRGPSLPVERLRRFAPAMVWVAPVVLVCCFWISNHYGLVRNSYTITETIGYSLVLVSACGVLLMVIDERTRLMAVLRSRALRFLGRISYGMYILHALVAPIFFSLRPAFARRGLTFLLLPVAFACITGMAALSFRYLESPFLRLKSVLAPRRDGAVAMQK